MKSKLTAIGAAVLASVVPAAGAQADETHAGSHNGPQVALIATGQVDDPLEDVLEHVTVLGTTLVAD
ncbi:hypothetical protein AB0M10_13045 [Streptomyces sp. NPDC051840]|uniref:hypothetical protein n=1 Tax=unclassified Streptomyces TaxID=2593676 RepID=UPI00342E13FC